MLPDSMDTLILSVYWRTEDISVIVIHVASYYVGKVFCQCPAACTAKIHRRVMNMIGFVIERQSRKCGKSYTVTLMNQSINHCTDPLGHGRYIHTQVRQYM